MVSLRQIAANRRNALHSTGPKTEAGKTRSRGNAVRHGLTAETVIEGLEDPEDYKAFELSVTADFNAQSAVERELVLRLAGLLWRLRRAGAIETGLLQIESEVLQVVAALQIGRSANAVRSLDAYSGDYSVNSEAVTIAATKPELPARETGLDIAQRFLRLSNLDNNVFERLGRYEMALWRQVRQTLFTLERIRRRSSDRSRRRQSSWQQMTRIPPVAEMES